MKTPGKKTAKSKSPRRYRVTIQVTEAEKEELISRYGKHKRGKQRMRDALLCSSKSAPSRASEADQNLRASVLAELHQIARLAVDGSLNGTPQDALKLCIAITRLTEKAGLW